MATPLVDKSPDRIAGMFDAIAPRYDLLNRVLSAGIDQRWRARAVRSLALTGRETLVDVCAGTADVALEAVGAGRKLLRRAGSTPPWSTPSRSAAEASFTAARVTRTVAVSPLVAWRVR